jgi:hypothetical protein
MTDSTSHSVRHSIDPREPDPNLIVWLKENCVSIGGAVFGALMLCLVAHYSSITVDWTRTKDFTDAFANLTQSFAFIAGGVWAYFKFAKGRTFQDRLIPTVTGKFLLIDGVVFLIATIQLQNVGLSRIAFDQKGSSVVVFEYVPSQIEEIPSVKSNLLTSFRVFGDKDGYIEPNEIVERQRLIALPRVSRIGYRLEIEVLTDSGYAWRATTIVDRTAFDDNENA